MATRGIFQLQKLSVYYCEYGGSSQVIRDYLASGQLITWATERPHVQIQVKVRNGKHPHVKADYKTQTKETYHQICLKSNKSLTPNIEEIFTLLANRSGRKIKKLTKPIYTSTPSIQGVWTPALNLQLTPEFTMEIIE